MRRKRVKLKSEVHSIIANEDEEGEQIPSSVLSLTSALDGGGSLTPRPGRFTPGNDPVPIAYEALWVPGSV